MLGLNIVQDQTRLHVLKRDTVDVDGCVGPHSNQFEPSVVFDNGNVRERNNGKQRAAPTIDLERSAYVRHPAPVHGQIVKVDPYQVCKIARGDRRAIRKLHRRQHPNRVGPVDVQRPRQLFVPPA